MRQALPLLSVLFTRRCYVAVEITQTVKRKLIQTFKAIKEETKTSLCMSVPLGMV